MRDVVIVRCDRPSAGFSSETLLIDVQAMLADAPYTESLVVRLPPSGPGTFPDYDLAVQAHAQHVAAANGIPIAAPVEVETDTRWLGVPFLVMPTITGHVGGQSPIHDAWITTSSLDTQATLHRNFFEVLVAIHHVDSSSAALGRALPRRALDAELAYWTRYLAWYGDGEELAPALSAALAWCHRHRPRHEPPNSLLWGDVRLGNVIFDEQRSVAAVLDWEMATIGPAEHDVAWYLSLEATENELFGRAVPGFLDRAAAVAYYEAQLGRALQAMEWFEIFALVRSTAILTRIVHLQERAGQPTFFPIRDNPVLGILERRIAAA